MVCNYGDTLGVWSTSGHEQILCAKHPHKLLILDETLAAYLSKVTNQKLRQ